MSPNPPKLVRPTPRQIRKAFGSEAVSAIDSHADAIEALNAQVLKLTEDQQKQAAQLDALLDGDAELRKELDWWITLAKEHEARLDRIQAPKKAWWTLWR